MINNDKYLVWSFSHAREDERLCKLHSTRLEATHASTWTSLVSQMLTALSLRTWRKTVGYATCWCGGSVCLESINKTQHMCTHTAEWKGQPFLKWLCKGSINGSKEKKWSLKIMWAWKCAERQSNGRQEKMCRSLGLFNGALITMYCLSSGKAKPMRHTAAVSRVHSYDWSPRTTL